MSLYSNMCMDVRQLHLTFFFFSGPSVWQTVGCALKCNRIARQATVSTDCFRSPQVELLLGDNGIVLHKDNGIRSFRLFG